MEKHALILLIQGNPADGEYIRQALANGEGLRVQSVERVATALARIAGGGVDLVILDLSGGDNPEIDKLDGFLNLRSKAPQMPIVVVCDSADDSLVGRTVKAGAADYVSRARCDSDLSPTVSSAIGRRLVQFESRPNLAPEGRKTGVVTTFLGAKGGVGTTTVALNVASALAHRGRVVLTEMRPAFGTLSLYFHLHHLAGNITHLLRAVAGRIDPAEIEARLWPYKNVPGLNILFGPQTTEECREIAAHSAEAVLKALSHIADHVVVDLPSCISTSDRAVIQESDCVLLVVEREPLCVESGKLILETLRAWNAMPPSIGSVIVNRVPLMAAPMDLSEIEMQLAIPTLGVIPPASDLCLAAQKAGKPLTVIDPDSLAAQAMLSLAEALAAPAWKPARAS